MPQTQPSDQGQQSAGAATARMYTAGRWVAGHGVEEALVAVPAVGAVALPVWWAQLPAAAAAMVAAGLWARHELRTRRQAQQAARRRVAPTPSAAALTAATEADRDDEDETTGPATGQQREVSSHG